MIVVVDSSALVSAFLPDEVHITEAQLLTDAQGTGRVQLIAPTLLPYEYTNAFLKALRQRRLTPDLVERILAQLAALGIGTVVVDPALALRYALQFGRSAYDAAYLALAEEEGVPLITADERLYNAVKEALPWVVWLPEWRRHIEIEPPEGSQGAEDE
ncbi:MAG: type II toxin-antitoxin system VapC family toxin [Anaerolineae bacterium]